ncbi:hypothetical protein [Leptolyngbya sp. 'hensonii']|uniref:hypothetical protein n=1 Tax=Leptolyngbya sp. 'hensonii' TaxID=1922337 RepID=UPI00118144D1|nr:hypothetical protein [Leptolyngbya sp. 'hensonii']
MLSSQLKPAILLPLLLFLLVNSARQTPAEVIQAFSGQIMAADWSKTIESYCQGGSEYYVLVVGSNRYPLNSNRDWPYAKNNGAALQRLKQQFQRQVGQTVVVRGTLITRTFQQKEHCPDAKMQCLSGSITCQWIRVSQH